MHLANLRSCCCCPALWEPWVFCCGESERHAFIACWNCGEFESTPGGSENWMRPFTLLRSGKFGTPCSRMHCENSASRSFRSDPLELPAAADAELDSAPELPPQPAATSANARSAAAAAAQAPRRNRSPFISMTSESLAYGYAGRCTREPVTPAPRAPLRGCYLSRATLESTDPPPLEWVRPPAKMDDG